MKCIILVSFSFAGDGYIEYYNLTNKAEWYFDNKKYDESLEIFQTAFKSVEVPKFKDIVLAAVILNGRGERKETFRLIRKYLRDSGGVNQSIVPYLEQKGIVFTHEQVKRIELFKIDTTTALYIKNKNSRLQIDSLFQEDQKIRKMIDMNIDSLIVTNQTGVSTMVDSKKWCQEIDSSNGEMIVRMIETGGLIENNQLIGFEFGVLLLHMQAKYFYKIEENLVRMIDLGNLDPWEFACARDRKNTATGKCLSYFAYTFHRTLLDCISFEEIIDNRQNIGLSIYYSRPSFGFYITPYQMMKIPFDEYLQKFGITKNI